MLLMFDNFAIRSGESPTMKEKIYFKKMKLSGSYFDGGTDKDGIVDLTVPYFETTLTTKYQSFVI